MKAKVLSDTQVRSFRDKEGKNVSFGDTPIQVIEPDYFAGTLLILRISSKYQFRAGDIITFDPYVPRKSWSVLKATNVKLDKPEKTLKAVGDIDV